MMLKTDDKGTTFSRNKQICCSGKIIDLSQPIVMAILNITSDSFFDGGSYLTFDQMLQQTERMLQQGATIIDIGAVSTRPGAEFIPVEEEIKRLLPVIELLVKNFPQAIISVDTCWAKVAAHCADKGAHIINDISGGQFDAEMFTTVAKLQLPYIMMHTQGLPSQMQKEPKYNDIIEDLTLYFSERLQQLYLLGAKDIILDPGFGFGKTLSHNFELLNRLDELALFFREPLLVGISRKSMICKPLHVNPPKALNGTTVLNTLALTKGASVLRVHDVKEAMESICLVQAMQHYNEL